MVEVLDIDAWVLCPKVCYDKIPLEKCRTCKYCEKIDYKQLRVYCCYDEWEGASSYG